jgi:hypothetical protein
MAGVPTHPRDVRPAAQAASEFRPRAPLTFAILLVLNRANTSLRMQGSAAEMKTPESMPVALGPAAGLSQETDRGTQADADEVSTNNPVVAQQQGIRATYESPGVVRAASGRVPTLPPFLHLAAEPQRFVVDVLRRPR